MSRSTRSTWAIEVIVDLSLPPGLSNITHCQHYRLVEGCMDVAEARLDLNRIAYQRFFLRSTFGPYEDAYSDNSCDRNQGQRENCRARWLLDRHRVSGLPG